MKLLLLFSGLVLSVSLVAQYPSGGIKSRLGWQTTGDGLVYRGSGAPAYSPGTMFNAWMYLDTTNFILYAYKNFQWTRLPVANNGLNFDGAYAQLGGTLIENTDIESDGFQARFGKISTSNQAYLNIFGSNPYYVGFRSYNGTTDADFSVGNGIIGMEIDDASNIAQTSWSKYGFNTSYLGVYGFAQFKMDSARFRLSGISDYATHALATTALSSKTLYRITGSNTLYINDGSGSLVSPNIQDNGTAVSILNSKPFSLGQWTTAGRPTGVTGYIGRNTTLGVTEEYNGSAWDQFAMLTKTQTFTGVNSFNNDIYLNNALKQNTITAYTLNYLNYEAQSTNHGVILKFDANGIPTDNMYGMEFNGKASGADLPGLLMIGSNSSKKIVFAQRNLGTSPQNYDLVFKNVAGDWWTGQDQLVIKQGGQVIVGTSTPIASSIFGVRSTTSASSPFPLQTETEANAITGERGNFQYETTANGLRWYNGTRKSYAIESTFARGTSTRIPIFDTNGQITESPNFLFDGRVRAPSDWGVPGYGFVGNNNIYIVGQPDALVLTALSREVRINGTGLVPHAGGVRLGNWNVPWSEVYSGRNYATISAGNASGPHYSFQDGLGNTINAGMYATGTQAVNNLGFSTRGASEVNASNKLWINSDGKIGIGTTSPSYIFDVLAANAIGLPRGTVAQRPTIASNTTPLRFNTDSTMLEYGNGSDWLQVATRPYVRSLFAAVPISNIYIANGSLTGNRTLHGAGYTLNINANTVFRDSVTVGNLPEFTPEYIAIADNTTGLLGKKKWIMPSANVYDGTSSGYFFDSGKIGHQVSGDNYYHLDYADTTGYWEKGNYSNIGSAWVGNYGFSGQDFSNYVVSAAAADNGDYFYSFIQPNNGFSFRKQRASQIGFTFQFGVDTASTVRMYAYGTGIKEAADLSKTQSNYVAAFATDGTITDLALGSGLGITSGNLVTNQVLAEQFNEITSTSSPQTLSSSISDNLINQGSTQASFTLNFPASPVDGQILKITYNNAITSLTLDGNGNTIVGTTVTTAVAGSQRVFKFYTGIGWIRQN